MSVLKNLPQVLLCGAATIGLLASTGADAAIVVSEIPALIGAPVAGVWYNTSAAGGAATIADLTGVGGALENDQPLPGAAGRLTTGFNNLDRGRVETFADFGAATTALTSGSLSYSYFKADVAGGNAAAAPSLQLTLFAPGGTGDNYGTLVYEPTWNQGVDASVNVPTGQWLTANIGATTGDGAASGGGWWWTGGFEQGNSGGGPPVLSLSEWATLFAADPDFADARVVSLGVNVGTYNQGVDSYFDDVQFSVPGGIDLAYDFAAIPEPSLAGIFGLITCGLLARRPRVR